MGEKMGRKKWPKVKENAQHNGGEPLFKMSMAGKKHYNGGRR
jgi:hypothetical protein